MQSDRTAVTPRDANRAVEHGGKLGRGHHRLHELVRHVFEQRLQIDFLLKIATHGGRRSLAHDGHDWLMVELRIVESVQQMDRARSRSRHAHADLASEFGVPAGHERGHFFVSRLDEVELALRDRGTRWPVR